jgi:hypothetical protein
LEGYSGWNTEEDGANGDAGDETIHHSDQLRERAHSTTTTPGPVLYKSLNGSSPFSTSSPFQSRPLLGRSPYSKQTSSKGSRSTKSGGKSLDIDAVSVSISDLDAEEDDARYEFTRSGAEAGSCESYANEDESDNEY